MKYPELIEPCKSAIKEERCLGCEALASPYFKGNKDCKLYDKGGQKKNGLRWGRIKGNKDNDKY